MQSTAILARRPVAERSIRVLVSPTPVTFAERRSVLQVLEQYGPVDVFTMTPGYHANFVSVTREATTAARLVACSPLMYRMPAPRKKTDVHIADLVEGDVSNAFNSDSTRPSITATATGDDEFAPVSEQAQFKLEIFPEPNYEHSFAASRSTLHRSWPSAYVKDKSYVHATLARSLPQNMAATGLAHWLLGPGCSGGFRTDSKSERLRLKSWLPSQMRNPQSATQGVANGKYPNPGRLGLGRPGR
ncbi:hypothetical protein E4U41_006517 [Claviceps citrina]|nr:hypothetical protein E4U41_006517 [Claviceps citrina]